MVLCIIMAAANTYLGLKAGMTVSASIPAAVISTAILRGIFRRGTILENNIVQTITSTGESLAAGAVFTIPALLMVGAWQEFKFWPTTLIAMLGGMLGIVFMVPLRRALIVERPDLKYPEGVACAEVLIAGQEGGKGIISLVAGLGLGALVKFFVTGLAIMKATVEGAVGVGRSVAYFGSDMSLALVAVGYIVRLQIAVLICLGGAIGWFVAVPILAVVVPGPDANSSGGLDFAEAQSVVGALTQEEFNGFDMDGDGELTQAELGNVVAAEGGDKNENANTLHEKVAATSLDKAWDLWTNHVKYIGVGTMLIGGLHSIWCVRKGIVSGIGALRGVGGAGGEKQLRTERDMPLTALMTVFAVSVFGTLLFYNYLTGSFGVAVATTILMVIAAFLFVAVATYIVGLVGSSNSPVSGMTICALLLTAAVLLVLGIKGDSAIAATLGVAGVVCCAACTAGDVAQDLKTGHLLGATPARQQSVEMIGVLIPAFFLAPIFTLLYKAYGINGIGADRPGAFLAPQANLFANLVRGIFGEGETHWNMIGIGIGIGVLLIILNVFLEKMRVAFRAHIMPIAVGIYLPVSLSVPILLGGLLHYFCGRRKGKDDSEGRDPGLLLGSGLIAGESLMGIGLAIPLVMGIELTISNVNEMFSTVFSLLVFGAVIVGYGIFVRRSVTQD